MANTTPNPQSGSILQNSELVLSLAILGLLVVFLVPLPTVMLDILLAFNLSMTVLLLLVTLSVKQPLDFSVFPSLLLILTLFRLALNVATTRLILLNGDAGEIVNAFGNFVVGGDLVVGLVIFLILIVIQFIVITRGAGRVSEVAARFTLDAMPGKQMAIDAEMNAGLIDESEARRRRSSLMRESEFYGTMDGASKFVRGDAIAGIIITAINLIGGIIIGISKGQSIAVAIKTYSILTIGDGLITQIPALIVATASGMLVTKSTSTVSLGQEISLQFASSAGPIRLGGFILFGLALVPGLPKMPFIVLGILLIVSSQRITRLAQAQSTASLQAQLASSGESGSKATTPPKSPNETLMEDFLMSDRISVEIGASLIPLVDSRRGPGLLDRITGLRRDLAKQGGLWVPAIRVKDNIQLDSDGYRILVGGREVGKGIVRPYYYLAINPSGGGIQLEGEDTREPAFGLPAKWIPDTERQRAEMNGYTVVDAPNVLITHLGEVVRRYAHELLSREDLKLLLDKVKETSPAVIDEMIPNLLTTGSLHRILTLLLEERIPISNLTRILESLATHAPQTKDVIELAERVRSDIGRTICDRFRDENGRIRAIVLDPRLEIELRQVTRDRQVFFDPARLEQMILKLAGEMRKASARGQEVALLCDSSIRRPLRQSLSRSLTDLSVIAYQEIPTDVLMEAVALIRPEDLIGGTSSVSAMMGTPTAR
jgi:flagellar biosynthesis protein FlhA